MIVRYDSFNNKIIFPAKVATGVLPEFVSAVKQWELRRWGTDRLILDFSNVEKAFANGMLGVISISAKLRNEGARIKVILPDTEQYQRFFLETNWAFLLDSKFPEGSGQSFRHFAQQFTSYREIPGLINGFMKIVMNHVYMPYDIVSALEWSVGEICDNVINHSDSAVGGYLQVIAYPQSNNKVAFTVADAGRGILNSLREGYPHLQNDVEAIDEAIKVGVTRNKQVGQGNGLAGTLRIINMTGGSFDIMSGRGRLLLTTNDTKKSLMRNDQIYPGTCISGQIGISQEFSVTEALTFGAVSYTPHNIIDAIYELQETDALMAKVAEESFGVGTREAGKEIRTKVLTLVRAKPGYKMIIDWQGIPVITSSFADEFIGKLFVALGKESYELIIRNINIEPLVEQLIAKAITERSLNPS